LWLLDPRPVSSQSKASAIPHRATVCAQKSQSAARPEGTTISRPKVYDSSGPSQAPLGGINGLPRSLAIKTWNALGVWTEWQ